MASCHIATSIHNLWERSLRTLAKQRLVLITATVILMIFISGCASLGTVLPPDIEKPPIQPGVPDDSPGEPPTTPVLSNLGGVSNLQVPTTSFAQLPYILGIELSPRMTATLP